MLPFFKVPARTNELGVKEPKPDWQQPHLQQLKQEIIVCSVAMFVCPFAAFFIVQNQQSLIDTYGEHKTNALAALAAVCAVQAVIFTIVIVKYWEDFMIVARGQGHVPYD